jgi:hypothetical protein
VDRLRVRRRSVYYREKTQYEYAVKLEPVASTATVWRRGWVPRTPHTWAEFLAPTVVTALIAWRFS